MMWRLACVWSSMALLPMVVVLLAHGSLLGLVYATSAAVAFGYHLHDEQQFRRLDHALAWAAIGANCWLAWHTHLWQATVVGVVAVLRALVCYARAHREHYDRHHTEWHVWCGIAGFLLAWGYVA